MPKNIHPIERTIRIILGIGLTSLAFIGPKNNWFLLGLIPLATGLLGWCPPYQLLVSYRKYLVLFAQDIF